MNKILFSLVTLLATLPILSAQTPDSQESQPGRQPVIVTSDLSVKEKVSSVRVAIQAGGAFRPGKIEAGTDPDFAAYQKKLRWGYSVGADLTWFFTDALGVGAKFNDIRVSNESQVSLTYENGSTRAGTLKDRIDIWYAGPLLSYRWLSRTGRNAFFVNYGLGYLGYQDVGMVIDPAKQAGGTLGLQFELGYDFGITKHLAAGIDFNMISGTLTHYTLTMNGKDQRIDLDKDEYMGLGHLALSVGLRYLF